MGGGETTGDLFGFDDSAMRQAADMARVATGKQRQIGERLAAITGAAKRPELARKEGIDVHDPVTLAQRIEALKATRDAWTHWSTNPELVGEIRSELGIAAQAPRAPGSLEQASFVPEPTLRERLSAAAAEKDAERNGLGRDLVKPYEGEGELFNPAPEQIEIPAAHEGVTEYGGTTSLRPTAEGGAGQVSETAPPDAGRRAGTAVHGGQLDLFAPADARASALHRLGEKAAQLYAKTALVTTGAFSRPLKKGLIQAR